MAAQARTRHRCSHSNGRPPCGTSRALALASGPRWLRVVAVTAHAPGATPAPAPHRACAEAAGEACFADTYNAVLTGFEQAKGSHRLTARLRRKDTEATVGEGDFSTFVAAPPLRPTTPWDSPQGRFIKLLRDAVVGWLYLDNVNPDDPGLAGPCTTGWNGRAQCQMPITPSTRYHPTHTDRFAHRPHHGRCAQIGLAPGYDRG